MSFVVDCSVTLAWQMPDEDGSALAGLFDRLVEEGAMVPDHWRLEVANSLLVAQRRGRIDARFRHDTLADLALLPFTIDGETGAKAWSETGLLAERHGLTIYDAAYLELAIRTGLPLATLDAALQRAADAEGRSFKDLH